MSSTKTGTANTSRNDLLHDGESFVWRVVALIVGVIFVIIGVALGVTVVLLPVGIPVTILGLVLCVAAIGLGRSRNSQEK